MHRALLARLVAGLFIGGGFGVAVPHEVERAPLSPAAARMLFNLIFHMKMRPPWEVSLERLTHLASKPA